MGRSEKQLDPQSGPLARLAVDLRELRRQAGGPTYREMSRTAGYSPSALSAAASGANLPSAGVLTSYVRACGGDVEEWLRRRAEVAAIARTPASAVIPAQDAKQEREPLQERRLDRRLPRRRRFARRTAGLLAAAIVGSMATVVPMAVWGAPSCLTTDHGRPAPAANCQPALSAH
ncbi:helix-turn-helix domain-containing protein [Catenulispora subtropica]|uniref:HTH cro/C1-type domain-containing protein n=1 Tax=Catenulispora subtropica TaxID=450798 RepID=A0ABN2R995_9ACTN